MEDNKTNAQAEDLNEKVEAAENECAEESKQSQETNAEVSDQSPSTVNDKPKTRRSSAAKKTDGDSECEATKENTTRKRTTVKKTALKKEDASSETAPATQPTDEETEKVSEIFNLMFSDTLEIVDAPTDFDEKALEEQPESPSDDDIEEYEHGEAQISIFSISSAAFDESSPEIIYREEERPTPQEDDEDEGEEIIPPDELFAYRNKIFADTTPVPDVDAEEEENTVSDLEDTMQEENVDDDGQYHFSDLEPISSSKNHEKESVLDKYDPKKPRKIDARFDIVELFVFTLLAVMILTTFFFRHSIVEGDSMKNTLHSGEHLIISDFLYTPKRGDIIVCEDYTTSIKKPIVKRVIAIEGDVITITSDKRVIVNGTLLDESEYVFVDGIDITKPIKNYVVPENELFVMGDHRNDSEDSRSIGTISEDAVLGKVILRFYPLNKFGPVK